MMKQFGQLAFSIFAVLLVSVMIFAVLSLSSFAVAANDITVRVTISDGTGALPVSDQKIKVADADADGKITVDEVLLATHKAKYTNKEDETDLGYKTVEAENGVKNALIWGSTEIQPFGICRNHAAFVGLDDVCKDGDSIVAFVYSDTDTCSDAFVYIECDTPKIYNGEDVTLTVNQLSVDESGKVLVLPLENAVILIDGKETKYVTNELGRVIYDADSTGIFTVSAEIEGKVIVPPAFTMVVNGPKTGDDSPILTYSFLTLLSFGVVVALVTTKPHREEE